VLAGVAPAPAGLAAAAAGWPASPAPVGCVAGTGAGTGLAAVVRAGSRPGPTHDSGWPASDSGLPGPGSGVPPGCAGLGDATAPAANGGIAVRTGVEPSVGAGARTGVGAGAARAALEATALSTSAPTAARSNRRIAQPSTQRPLPRHPSPQPRWFEADTKRFERIFRIVTSSVCVGGTGWCL
jgi:hypothetical protein